MKCILKLLLVPLITLTFAAVSLAQRAPVTPVPVTPAPITPATPTREKKLGKKEPKTTTITGEITSVDAKAGTLTVKVNGKEMSFVPETKGAKSALKKVKVGEQVRVSYGEKDGKLSARSVTEAKAKTMAKAKTKARKKTEVKGMEKKAEKKEEPKSAKK
jgi:hypothetical protein